jgi:hypothetical protein
MPQYRAHFLLLAGLTLVAGLVGMAAYTYLTSYQAWQDELFLTRQIERNRELFEARRAEDTASVEPRRFVPPAPIVIPFY